MKQTGHGTSSASTDVPPTEVPRVVETGRIAVVWDLYGVYICLYGIYIYIRYLCGIFMVFRWYLYIIWDFKGCSEGILSGHY